MLRIKQGGSLFPIITAAAIPNIFVPATVISLSTIYGRYHL